MGPGGKDRRYVGQAGVSATYIQGSMWGPQAGGVYGAHLSV